MKNGYFEFLGHFVELTDPRDDRGRNHQLLDMIAIALCGTICGANSWADIERFAKAHMDWFLRFLELPFGVPSHDTFGRVFRRLDTSEFQHCLRSWVEQLQFQLEGQTVAIDGKTLRGSPAELKDKFTGLQTIGLIRRERILTDGTVQSEISYFISSLAATVRVHAWHLRNHWTVENTLHHTLDVTFTEDASRIRKGNGPEIVSALRRLALSILKQDTTIKDNVRGKRLTAGWDLTKLQGMLLAFQAV